MTFGGGERAMSREDPDFHQRFVATVGPHRVDGRWDASEDEGTTWRKDFDLVFERTAEARGPTSWDQEPAPPRVVGWSWPGWGSG